MQWNKLVVMATVSVQPHFFILIVTEVVVRMPPVQDYILPSVKMTDLCSTLPCSQQFFLRERDVTNRCPLAERCSNKMCNSNRKCMEVIKPATCPSYNPQCRQILKAKCILVDKPPTSCEEVKCERGSVCRVHKRQFYCPKISCVPLHQLRSCSNRMWSRAHLCRQRVKCKLKLLHHDKNLTSSPR